MKYTIGVALIFFCIFSLAQTNPFPVIFTNESGHTKCSSLKNIDYFDIQYVLDSIKTGFITDTAFLACCYHQVAVEYYLNYDNINSIKYNRKAKHLRTKFNDGLYWKSELNSGIIFFELNEFTTAVQHLKKAYQAKGFKRPEDSISILKNIADSYAKLGEHESALEFGQQAIQVNASTHKKNDALNSYISNLILSNDTNNLKKAIELGEKAYRSSKLNNDNENLIIVLNNLGHAHQSLGNYNQAIKYYEEALNLISEGDIESRAILLNDVATVLLSQKKYKLSVKKLKEAFDVFNDFNKNNYHFYIAINENLGDNYVGLGKLDSALIFYQKALSKITNTTNDWNIFENPNPNDSLYIYSYPDMIRVLDLKATATFLYYQQNRNIQYLNLANQTYQTAFDFHDKLQKEISTENSRLFQAKNIVPYIENALKVAHQQQENGQNIGESAFRFMEKNKATVLLQSMNEADALQFANLPDSLLEQEKELKIALTFYKKQFNNAIKYEDTAEIVKLENLEFETKQAYDRLINNLETNYPDYYQLKYQQNQAKLTDLQSLLDDKTAILEYFVGDSSIFVLSIEKDQSKLYKIKKPEYWQLEIKDFRASINPDGFEDEYTEEIFKCFAENAHILYQNLLQKPLADLGESITKIQIIPDAELNSIPFELLLTKNANKSEVNYSELSYLFKGKTISYAYSGALLVENMSEAQKTNTYNYVGFAPSYKAKTYNQLKFALTNTKDIAKILKGKWYIENEATKANFKNDVHQYKIFHLAMHGIVNNDDPLSSKLIFSNIANSDYELHAYELYNMRIPAQLGVLSACETGTGLQARGEGIMSLSRAFTYAGCSSLVMSLWSIDDKATVEIVKSFFENLSSNSNKDEALRQAKLDYLSSARSDKTHPKYWAGLVLSGNTSLIEF